MQGFQGRAWAALCTVLMCAAPMLAAGGPGAEQKSKQKPKPAVLEIKDLKVSLEGKTVNLDGTLHNAGERAIEKLVLSFHFFDTEHQPVSTLKLEIDDETIDPGEDSEIHASANEPARAVSLEVTAADRGERDLKVVRPGPYPIE